MSIKKICKTICAVLILATVISVGVCVGAQRVADLDTTGYSSAPFATVCKDILIFSQNGKYGLMDYNGNVLVEPMYNDFLYPDEDGLVIFYEFADGLSKSDFNIGFVSKNGVLCNIVHDTLFWEDEQLDFEYIKSADYNMNSYIYNKAGTLVCYGINTYIASIDDDIIEVRTKPRSADTDLVSFLYKLEYKRISDGSVIYSNDNCIDSTGFNEGYAVISENYGKNLSLTVINSAGEIISKKNESQIFDETKYDGGWGAHHIDFTSDVHNNMVVFYFTDAPIGSDFYIYDLEKDSYKLFIDKNNYTKSFWWYNWNGFRQVFLKNSYKSVNRIWDEETMHEHLCLGQLDNPDFVGNIYKDISFSFGTDIFLVETLDGRWGYIDTNGNELGFYKDATNFVNGKALVLDDENRAYIINDKLERISEYIYDVDGVTGVSVKKNGMYYLVTNFNEINGIPEITVTVNGNMVMFDQPPIIENGRTLVPLRAIFEALNATVEWNDATQTVTATKDGIVIKVQIGNNIMTKNGTQVPLDVPAKLLNGRTLVPARAVAEAFGCNVDWNEAAQHVIITA